MIYPLTTPVPANFTYDALRVENMRYEAGVYTADVFGISGGQPMPFIFRTRTGSLQRITQASITDAEVDEVIAAHPEITVRIDAGMLKAVQKLMMLVES
jgi:hypothetical protein